MSDERIGVTQFDDWLKDDSDVAALVVRQWLEPVEGKDAVIFPPTYAKPERMREEDWTGYNIDRFDDGSSVCQIDSVGSQANRMEPIFKADRYAKLVPQITITAGSTQVNLLDAGHRAADAIVRFSDLKADLNRAFSAYKKGNAEPLAKIAPTSLIFGAWDSRDTNVKLPRIVRSVIRAHNVRPLHRSAQYVPPVDYVAEGIVDKPAEAKDQKALSELGLSHAPAPWSFGGVQVLGDIRREAILNLVTLRALKSDAAKSSEKLQRYALGLALVALTAPQTPALREGCELVRDPEHPFTLEVVRADGRREGLQLTSEDAFAFAQRAAEEFGVGASRSVSFNAEEAKGELGKSGEERKAGRRAARKKGSAEPQEGEEGQS